ncbi:4-hydroxyphenylpyruvate dioxygenase [Methylobacterium sp. 4-46]|uniref:bifunctional sugar phosphate isomerase/epimerase/4-hydroxyphenylpyruvate dioxygenase family protein n=1 Tax=unclassified Methylobacterium TaxID=2615210 RepID=UPI000152BE93|nr:MULTISPECIES: sugar phosphate isomerase/epimerase and 4-hydroxyphenylpyruvate domain-containing protein [Methylobacterium]ACA19085.1 4-hydroxyphenylpyruvate dioxygenase [Methylobacterium sp. 4-46]WFT78298.1 TIM barrel protein [Methylobacterium nodulans]
MKLAIATVCLSGTLGEKLEAIAAAGFSEVEIFENDLLSFSGTPRDLRRRAEDLGLAVAVYQPFRDFEGMPAPQRAKAFARAERKFDTMQELGCDLLMVCSNVSPDSLGGLDRAAEDFRELGERAARRGMRVGYEALAWGRHVSDYRDAWEIVRRADHPAVGFVLDSFHVLARGTDLGAIRSIPREKIVLVQMADAPRLAMDHLSWSRHYRCFPGQGDLPIPAFVDALGATGFDGILSLEIFSDRFRAGSARGVALDGRRSLLVMLDDLRRRAGAPEDPAGRGPAPLLPALPPRAACEGIEFIEFAMDEEEARAFESVLSGLGFARTARHRSKAVTRWSQGAINLVVNTEKEGFAHSFQVTHGASVCAVALRVDDAGAALERARALLDEPFRQAVAPGELDIPAVRGVGGSLLYLVDRRSGLDRLWDVDFEPLAPEPVRGAGLVAVDHLAQSMRHEEMLTWLLFYTGLFDLAKLPVQDVVDPGGVVESQAVEAPGAALRLVLNASQSSRTLSSRFLSEALGGGVQHVALATDDIVATVASLRAAGVALLPIPENYYDDLEARTDLPPETLARLRDGNILYDREGGAEFFQVYTRGLLGGGFAFEIVERRGYRGYGAANAPIRLAAQTRLAPHPALPTR